MDSGNIVYLIAVIIYFIYTALKRGKTEQPQGEQDADSSRPEEQHRPVSFDELLKEIRSGQQDREKDLEHTGQGKRVQPVKPNQPDPRSIEKEAPAPKMEETTFGKYEGYVRDIERPKLKTLDEQVTIPDPLEIVGVVEEGLTTRSRTGEKRTNRYAEMLKNPQTVKDAVILSEILNRKHF